MGDIVWCETPRAMINRLLPSITNDSAIAVYVNSHFGTSITARRVNELRRLMPQVRTDALSDGPPIGFGERRKWELRAIKANARFVDRLREVGAA